MTVARSPLGFALVGCGGAARDIARAIDATKDAVLVAVHDLDPARATAIASEGPHRAAVMPSLGSLLRDDAVDIVAVALPHDRLSPTAVAALRAGRPVLVEKPGATTARGIRAIRDAATAADRSVGVMFELRRVASVVAARDLVRTGALGRLRAVRIQLRKRCGRFHHYAVRIVDHRRMVAADQAAIAPRRRVPLRRGR